MVAKSGCIYCLAIPSWTGNQVLLSCFSSKNQQARVCLNGNEKGLPQEREPKETHALEKLCLGQLCSQLCSSSLPSCHSLEFNLTHSPFFYSAFASVSVVPSYSNPVILHRAGFVFPAILVRIGRFVDWWSKENYPVWILSYMTLLKTKGWMFRDNMSVLSYFICLL